MNRVLRTLSMVLWCSLILHMESSGGQLVVDLETSGDGEEVVATVSATLEENEIVGRGPQQVHGTCDTSPCKNGGRCIPRSPYVCECTRGFEGPQCGHETPGQRGPHPCVPNPCMNGGTCNVNPAGGYRCFCRSGYQGLTCRDRTSSINFNPTNPCVPNPCPFGSTCSVLPGAGTHLCQVNPGYDRPALPQGNACVPNPCRNGATCNVLPSGQGYRCFCAGGYTGLNCQNRPSYVPPSPQRNACVPNPCRNAARCNVVPGGIGYRCFCVNGYTGTNCETPSFVPPQRNPCVPNPCRNSATCNVLPGGVGYKCFCRPSFSGVNCEYSAPLANPCVPNPCLNGQCQMTGATYVCRCYTGYYGPRCSQRVTTPAPNPLCQPNPCHNGGRCLLTPGGYPGYRCYCANGYTGTTCLIPPANPCVPNPCIHGTCQVFGTTSRCLCSSGYHGPRCSQPITRPPNPCVPNPCIHGTCQVFGTTYTCLCNSGYHGPRCSQPITRPPNPCVPNPCRNGAGCNAGVGGGFKCFCINGYTGIYCETAPPPNPCVPNHCQNGGQCLVNPDGRSFRCSCINGYTGVHCTVPPRNPCIPNPCPTGGTCVATGLTSHRCISPPNPCIHFVCYNGGTCNAIGGLAKCFCTPSFFGDRCERRRTNDLKNPCNPSPCKGGCVCELSCRHALGYYCRGTSGLLGKTCSIPAPTVTCGQSAVNIQVNGAIVDEYDGGVGGFTMFLAQSSTMIPTPTCPAQKIGTAYVLTLPLPFTGCGASVSKGPGGKTTVANMVWLNKLLANGAADMPVPILHFKCVYDQQYNIVTALKPSIMSSVPVITKNGRTSANGVIELCKTGSSCPNQCPAQYSLAAGAVYTVGERIHTTFRPANLQGGNFQLEELFLSCSPSLTMPYTSAAALLLRDGCLAASSGKYLPTTVRPATGGVCASFQVPKLVACSEFYIHAKISPCTMCRAAYQNCISAGRRKRASEPDAEESIRFQVFGPVFVIDGESGDVTRVMYPGEKYLNQTTGVLVLKDDVTVPDDVTINVPLHVALAILIFMALIIFVVLAYHNWHLVNAHCGRKF